MKITKQIDINDEPHVNVSTGIRTVEVTYFGPKYLYVEVSKSQQKILAFVYGSDSQDIDTALERCNVGDPDLICVELEANDSFLPVCSFYPHQVTVEDYSEDLPDGEKFEDKYITGIELSQFFNFRNMKFDHETKQFTSIEFHHKTEKQEQDFLSGLDLLIDKVTAALEQNTYTTSDLATITTYKNELVAFRDNYDGSIKFWKLKFPVCTIPY